jgi:LysR family transcriptional regulator, glycine cleavage system transcriptional activator
MSRAPLHALQGFLTAARLRNLSRAAEAMHLTVSAMSHQMRALEERFGRPLLLRGPRGIALTPDGQQLYDRIAPHLDAIEHAMRTHGACRDDVLTISVTPTLASSWLVPRLGDFLGQHPELEINLQSSTQLVDFNRDTDVDAAVRFGPGAWPGVIIDHLFDDWVTPTASPALIARLGKPRGTADFGSYPLLGDPGGRWQSWFERFGGTPPKRFVANFNDSESLHRAALEGMGIALGRLTLTRPLIDSGRLLQLSDQRLKAEYSHYLVHPPRTARHRGFVAFREWLLVQARDYAAAFITEVPVPSTATKRAPRKAVATKKRSTRTRKT